MINIVRPPWEKTGENEKSDGMRQFKFVLFTLFCCTLFLESNAQDEGSFSGSLESNVNWFLRDTSIGASNTRQYDDQLSGGEAWLNLNYSVKGFDFGLRFDAFLNSNLENPAGSYSAQGIGFWQIRKKTDRLDITVGHIYDQIGSGIVYRAYEERPLFIDNALIGLRAQYDLIDKDNSSLSIKGFAGRQRRPFSSNKEDIVSRAYQPTIKGLALDGYWGDEEGTLSFAPGFGVVNRTLDDNTMGLIVANINTYDSLQAFVPKYNVYSATLYNTLTYKNFSWYVEGAYKTKEAVRPVLLDSLVNRDGYVIYTSLGYSQKGFGVTLEAKRTQNFSFRVSPLETGLIGVVGFLPPMTRVNTYRLTARYNAATQEFGEMAFQADLTYSPKRTLNFGLNFSNITDLDGDLLYRESHLNVRYRKPRKYSLVAGFQFQQYNQEIYEQKPAAPLVHTYIPYVDFLYKFNKKTSIRAEAQYMYTEEDFGQWIFGLAEMTFAPNWIFTTSHMINIVPKNSDDIGWYPTVSVVYSHKAHRFSLAYVKQVEGIVCSGGICRFEPAFSGVKFGLTSTF